jgi:hypothetical protein
MATTPFPNPAPRIYSTEIERANRLKELNGLTAELLMRIVQEGLAIAADCTLNHPPFYRGMKPWGEIVKVKREMLIPLGWKRMDDGNYSITLSGDGTVAIAVATGDEHTGNKDESPCTKSRKGPHTEEVVTKNDSLMHTLFGDIRPTSAELEKINARMTWLLLFRRDEEKRATHCELSLPSRMNQEGQIDGWVERIILDSIPFGGEPSTRSTDVPNVPQTPAIEIDVKRRSA